MTLKSTAAIWAVPVAALALWAGFGVMDVTAAFAAGGQDSVSAKKIADYPVLEKLQSGDEKLFYDYLGDKYGLDAWLLSGPDLMQVIYVLPDEKAALVGGTMVNPDGTEASTTLLQEFLKQNPERATEILEYVRSSVAAREAPQTSALDASGDKAAVDADKGAKQQSPSENFWRHLTAINGVAFGDNKEAPRIFAILDPAQPDTKIVWNVLAPLAEKGHLSLHVVPLAATSADSIMDVASILGDKNPQQAWRDLMDGQKPDGTQTPEAHGVLRMKSIVELAQSLNLRHLPLMVYRVGNQGEKSGAVRVVRGLPKDWVALFSEMGMGQD